VGDRNNNAYPGLEPLEAPNLRERIELRIRNAILSGSFGPGERLIESAIAEHLSVSRGPVREALSALDREGIVVHVPRKGFFVIDFTDKDLEEIYSLRLLLEREALSRAMDRFTESDDAHLQSILDELDQATLEREPERIVDLDLSFHDYVCRLADHSRLYGAWHSMSTQARVLVGLTSKTHYSHPEEPKELHMLILKAMRRHDLPLGIEYLTDHIQDAQNRAAITLEHLRRETVELPA
jgi:DNA-binding GntR family transcriptional regulator